MNMDAMKRGGKIKKRGKRQPKRKVAKKKTGFIGKDQVFTQPAFQMFGYRLAPQVPIMQTASATPAPDVSSKLDLVLSNIARDRKAFEDQKKISEEVIARQQPAFQPAIRPAPVIEMIEDERVEELEREMSQIEKQRFEMQQDLERKREQRNAYQREYRKNKKAEREQEAISKSAAASPSVKPAVPVVTPVSKPKLPGMASKTK